MLVSGETWYIPSCGVYGKRLLLEQSREKSKGDFVLCVKHQLSHRGAEALGDPSRLLGTQVEA